MANSTLTDTQATVILGLGDIDGYAGKLREMTNTDAVQIAETVGALVAAGMIEQADGELFPTLAAEDTAWAAIHGVEMAA